MSEWRLRIGKRLVGLTIRPDADYSKLWRIHYQGQMSDMANLSRAKDAALSWVRPRGGPPVEDIHWEAYESRAEASPMR